MEVDLVLSHTPSAPPKKKSLGTLNPKRRSWLRVGAAFTAREGNDEGAADRPPLAKATMRAPRPKIYSNLQARPAGERVPLI